MSSLYLSLQTPLDKVTARYAKFNVHLVQGREMLCGDFSYTVKVSRSSRLTGEEIEKLVGKRVTACIGCSVSGQPIYRYINGLVYNLRELGMSRAPLKPDHWQYRLEIGSWLKQLSYAKECRVFQKNSHTNVSIVKELLTELGLVDFRDQTRKAYPRRSYVTMYNETYYDFIIRLLQEEGIVWRFEHREKNHVLVFYDDSFALPELDSTDVPGQDRFTSFCRKSGYHPLDGCQLSDFEYDNPPQKTVGKPGKSTFRHFAYPGYFARRDDGEEKANRLKAVFNANNLLFQGRSTIRKLEAGKRFTLQAPMLAEHHKQSFLIRKLELTATPTAYENSFTAMSSTSRFIYDQADKIMKPTIIGNQTALVVGGKNAANVKVDSQGRVLVRFHWDRHSPEQAGTAFIRNMMPAAGHRRGFVFNPQIDDEVVVAFENGDPDKPIIVGRVYSANQRPPLSPVNNPDQSTIQPRRGREANRILFNDESGSENLEVKAQKDMKIKVGADLNLNVEDNLTILADNLTITANGNVLSGNIITLAGGAMTSIAGNAISNTTGLAAGNIVGGLMNNLAGANGINMALGMVSSKSGGHTVSAAPLIFNTTAGSIDTKGKGGVTNIGFIIANTATELIENSAGKKVNQKAALAIITHAQNETNQFDKESTTKALMVKDKGETAINKG